MADDGPQAKRSKPGPPAMARVESCILGATHYIVGLGSNATHVRDTDNLSKALADGVRDGLVGGDVGLDLQPE